MPPVIEQAGVPVPHPLVVCWTVGEYSVPVVPECSGLDVVMAHPLNVRAIGLLILETNT